MSFQERLKELLEENQINYNVLAVKTKIPVTTLSNYINRGSSPSITQLNILADFFEVSVDYLIGRSDDFGNIVISSGTPAELSEQEKDLLNNFNKLSIFERDSILVQVEALAKKQLIKK